MDITMRAAFVCLTAMAGEAGGLQKAAPSTVLPPHSLARAKCSWA